MVKQAKFIFIICTLAILICSCRNTVNVYSVEDVLELNPRLQKVLDHYKDDSLKYLAAEYLIKNLPYHYSLEGEALKNYMRLFELHGKRTLYPDKVLDSIRNKYGPFRLHELKKKSDIYIDPDYLIDNIDWAFKVWREQPWGKNVPFDMFCDYILPYRMGDEVLKPWREEIYKLYNPLLDSVRPLPEAEDPLFVSKIIMDTLHRGPINFTGLFSFGPHYGADVVKWRSGSCRDFTDLQNYVFRALGIPCSEEFMPNRGNGNVAHYLNAVFDKKGNTYYCSILDPTSELKDPTTMWDPKGKIYRRTFGINEKMLEDIDKPSVEIHPGFRFPCMADVTKIYSGKKNWMVEISDSKLYSHLDEGETVYLCSSSMKNWVPIAYGKYKEGKACFRDLQGQLIMRVATYKDKELIMQSDPFLLDRQHAKIRFLPSGGKMKNVTLLNKFDLYFEPFIHNMVGGVFEGSNSLTFKNKDTLYTIRVMPNRLFNVAKIKSDKKYRYVRFYGADGSNCNISELAFYEKDNDTKLQGRIIGTPGSKGVNKEHDLDNVFDGDPYTSFDYVNLSGGWVGLDLGIPHIIDKIVYTARNRDNYIRIDDEYELFYCDKGNWVSLGKKKAVSDSIVFKVPQGALLYLKDYTRGNSERIFEYRDGKQIYW